MRVYASVKQLGKKNNFITKQEIEINDDIYTLKDFITHIVLDNVNKYNEKQRENQILDYLSDKVIVENSKVGKINFGFCYNEKKAKQKQAIETALLAFNDGIYRVFINDEEIEDIEESIYLKEDDNITFVRLVMLAGRLW
ncbi:hypothetical protein SH2C18_18920 [Clostridium sediminicola]|uniref:hypothetical protein n=1 Tax=Clostridium sediminicola TaxID=3114879 RepID=UPI0031F23437